jgi:RNA polymerase sigma-70 factor (ECF subfamily)
MPFDDQTEARDVLPDDRLDDASLMAAIARGDQGALTAFAHRHAARCIAVAQRIVGNGADAEEIVQDALLRVWQRAGEWRRTDARVTTWLYRIVVNLAIDSARKNRRRFVPIEEAGDPADPAPTPQMIAEERQLGALMAAAIAALPERQRVALTLCCCDELDCAEAAAVMQISVSAMESLLVRGRRTLRWQLGALDPEAARRTRQAHRENGPTARSHEPAPFAIIGRRSLQSFA